MTNWEADIRRDTRGKVWKEAEKKMEEAREETKKRSGAVTLSRYVAKIGKSLTAAMDDLDMPQSEHAELSIWSDAYGPTPEVSTAPHMLRLRHVDGQLCFPARGTCC